MCRSDHTSHPGYCLACSLQVLVYILTAALLVNHAPLPAASTLPLRGLPWLTHGGCCEPGPSGSLAHCQRQWQASSLVGWRCGLRPKPNALRGPELLPCSSCLSLSLHCSSPVRATLRAVPACCCGVAGRRKHVPVVTRAPRQCPPS